MSERELGGGGVGVDRGGGRRIRVRGSICDLPKSGMRVVESSSSPVHRRQPEVLASISKSVPSYPAFWISTLQGE